MSDRATPVIIVIIVIVVGVFLVLFPSKNDKTPKDTSTDLIKNYDPTESSDRPLDSVATMTCTDVDESAPHFTDNQLVNTLLNEVVTDTESVEVVDTSTLTIPYVSDSIPVYYVKYDDKFEMIMVVDGEAQLHDMDMTYDEWEESMHEDE